MKTKQPGRKKTALRLRIEAFLADESPLEERDDWLAIEYADMFDRNRIYSMAYNMRLRNYPIELIEMHGDKKIIWIRRSN